MLRNPVYFLIVIEEKRTILLKIVCMNEKGKKKYMKNEQGKQFFFLHQILPFKFRQVLRNRVRGKIERQKDRAITNCENGQNIFI